MDGNASRLVGFPATETHRRTGARFTSRGPFGLPVSILLLVGVLSVIASALVFYAIAGYHREQRRAATARSQAVASRRRTIEHWLRARTEVAAGYATIIEEVAGTVPKEHDISRVLRSIQNGSTVHALWIVSRRASVTASTGDPLLLPDALRREAARFALSQEGILGSRADATVKGRARVLTLTPCSFKAEVQPS